jgi:hypothetical protein
VSRLGGDPSADANAGLVVLSLEDGYILTNAGVEV